MYVGYARKFDQRKYQHQHGYGHCDVNKWERKMLAIGLRPIVEHLQDFEDQFYHHSEQGWISYFKSIGCTLFNRVPYEDH